MTSFSLGDEVSSLPHRHLCIASDREEPVGFDKFFVLNSEQDGGGRLSRWHANCISQGMLRITIHDSGNAVLIKLEGRVAGPWAEELSRAWGTASPNPDSKKVLIDLCGVTYADESGKQVLIDIFSHSNAELITGALWTQDLAEEVIRKSSKRAVVEDRNGTNA